MSRTIGIAALLCLVSACTVHVNQCADGIRDGNESDVDCGGSCGPCGVGRACTFAADCVTGDCVGFVCVTPPTSSCTDHVKNGAETDVDCGGSDCPACSAGERCLAAADCTTQLCTAGVCTQPVTATCDDFTLNGNETDVDCGGDTCPACGDGRVCKLDSDCASQACSAGRCITPTFTPAPAADVYLIKAGAGVTVAPGSVAGYGITAASTGSSFRLVWTGDGNATGEYREFYGSVSTDGTFSSVTPGCSGQCTLNSGDYVSQPYAVTGGYRVDFDAFTVNNLDGFDFTVAGGASGTGEPVYFDLYIDGQPQPTLVFFTDSSGQQSSPQAIPFGLSSQ
jgi:hypothetical protein